MEDSPTSKEILEKLEAVIETDRLFYLDGRICSFRKNDLR
jgi:hypothetical protein